MKVARPAVAVTVVEPPSVPEPTPSNNEVTVTRVTSSLEARFPNRSRSSTIGTTGKPAPVLAPTG